MIIDNTYFKGDIYIPNAKPGITSNVTEVDGEVKDFIYEYAEECLFDCLGPLFIEFKTKLDSSKENGLIENAEEKWDHLLNGISSYVDAKGNTKSFKGIRFKSGSSSDYNKSFLANYVYFFYESNQFIQTSGVGDIKPKSKNAEVVSPSFKVTKAWRKFFELVQGESLSPRVVNRYCGIGLDFYKGSNKTTLYQFIKDMNELNEETYVDFKPKNWTNINQFGI